MPLIGFADLDRPIDFDAGRIHAAFGGGAFRLLPLRCAVPVGDHGRAALSLEIVRALDPRQSRATLTLDVLPEYAMDEALARVRREDPAATVAPCVLTDWWFRIAPTPALQVPPGLEGPLLLASNGLGAGRLAATLTLDGALVLESLLASRTPLPATAEARFEGVSPRLPVVVRLDSAALLPSLMALADSTGELPRGALVAYFRRDPTGLPLAVSGPIAEDDLPRFAEAMTDRIVARFGRYVGAATADGAPRVRLEPPPGSARIAWALIQPVAAERHVVLPIDLLSAARAQVARDGLDSIVVRRNAAAASPFGATRITALCNLPAARTGVEALGVKLTFPPRPPWRPQARIASAVFEPPADMATIEVTLAPGEPVAYRYSTFAVVVDDAGGRQLESREVEARDSTLRISAEEFPVEIAVVEVAPALDAIATVSGECIYEVAGREFRRAFAVDSAREVAIAVPRARDAARIECTAAARDGSGTLRAGPFEALNVRLDLASFATYGPREAEVTVRFDDGAAIGALSLLPDGLAEDDGNITSLSFTPAEPVRSFHWFAASPFHAGFRYRAFGVPGPWTAAPGGALSLRSSQLRNAESARRVPVRAESALVVPRPRRVGTLESAPAATEAAITPAGTSPAPQPSDELLYPSLADPSRKLFVPRYALDVQAVSGQQRYRIAMIQGETSSSLQVNLVAAPAPSLIDAARGASEYPHTLSIHLEYLVAPPAGALKTLELGDVARNGAIVTASVTFATLQERDDVYRALTDPQRRARLAVRRSIDVSVPPPAPGLGLLTMVALPIRPITLMLAPAMLAPAPLPVMALAARPAAQLRKESAAMRALGSAVALAEPVRVARLKPPLDMRLPRGPIVSTPPEPANRAERIVLEQAVEPDPFQFPPALHGYVFQGLVPTGGAAGLVRFRLAWKNQFFTYLQDAARPWVVYCFPDRFKVARRRDAPFTPFMAVRAGMRPDGTPGDVVVDYVVAPWTDARRLDDARRQLLAEPRFGATRVQFQPFSSSDVRYFVERPVGSGSQSGQRGDAALVLQGALKDTLTMSRDDFTLLFDTMMRGSATTFVGRVEIDVPAGGTEVVAFAGRFDDLEGDMLSYAATLGTDGVINAVVRNETESALDVNALDAWLARGGQSVRGIVQGTALPHAGLAPGEQLALPLRPETALEGQGAPEVTFDLSSVAAKPEAAGVLDSILDRSTIECFRVVEMHASASYFEPVAGREAEKIEALLVTFEGGRTGQLDAATLVVRVRVDYRLDDVVLRRDTSKYRYAVTVVRKNGRQDHGAPIEDSADIAWVSVTP